MSDYASKSLNIGFGCVGLSAFKTYRDAERVLDAAFESGITHFDVARVYGQGFCERVLGQYMRRRRIRLTVATKFGLGTSSLPPIPLSLALWLNWMRKRRSQAPQPAAVTSVDSQLADRTITKDDVRREFDASRRALGLERIEIYLLHEGLPRFLDENALSYLLDLKASGVIGTLGLAAPGRFYLSLNEHELAPFDILQYERGLDGDLHTKVHARFPRKQHVLHTCFLSTVTPAPRPREPNWQDRQRMA